MSHGSLLPLLLLIGTVNIHVRLIKLKAGVGQGRSEFAFKKKISFTSISPSCIKLCKMYPSFVRNFCATAMTKGSEGE